MNIIELNLQLFSDGGASVAVSAATAENMQTDAATSVTQNRKLFDRINEHTELISTAKPQEKVKLSKEYQEAEVNEDITKLVAKVKSGNFKANDIVTLGVLSDKISSQLKRIIGIDVSGYKIRIEARQIEHILRHHGINGKSDHSMASDIDIAKMGYTLKSPDAIRFAGKSKAYSYTKNRRNKTADTVLYEKTVGNKSYYVVVAVAETNAKTLYIVSAFIGKTGYKKGSSQLIDA